MLEKLPNELGSLECLKELLIEGTIINHLPEYFSVERVVYYWVERASSVMWFYISDTNPRTRNVVLRSAGMILRSSKDLEETVHKELL